MPLVRLSWVRRGAAEAGAKTASSMQRMPLRTDPDGLPGMPRDGCDAARSVVTEKCLCVFRGQERFAYGACFAMHETSAIGFVNAEGECIEGYWAGRVRPRATPAHEDPPQEDPRRPCTVDNCGHMRQLDAIATLLQMSRGTRSVLDELRARVMPLIAERVDILETMRDCAHECDELRNTLSHPLPACVTRARHILATIECGETDPVGWGGTCIFKPGHDGAHQYQSTRAAKPESDDMKAERSRIARMFRRRAKYATPKDATISEYSAEHWNAVADDIEREP